MSATVLAAYIPAGSVFPTAAGYSAAALVGIGVLLAALAFSILFAALEARLCRTERGIIKKRLGRCKRYLNSVGPLLRYRCGVSILTLQVRGLVSGIKRETEYVGECLATRTGHHHRAR